MATANHRGSPSASLEVTGVVEPIDSVGLIEEELVDEVGLITCDVWLPPDKINNINIKLCLHVV